MDHTLKKNLFETAVQIHDFMYYHHIHKWALCIKKKMYLLTFSKKRCLSWRGCLILNSPSTYAINIMSLKTFDWESSNTALLPTFCGQQAWLDFYISALKTTCCTASCMQNLLHWHLTKINIQNLTTLKVSNKWQISS